jgi:LacI family transcriptional regulator
MDMPVEESVTLMDVARAAGISKATASRALSGNGAVSSNVRQAVKDAAERLGFEVNPYAQRLSTGMARNVVGLFALTLDYMTWQSMSHLHYELASRGYEAPLYTYGYSQEDWPDYRPLLSTLSRQQPQGIICNTFKLLPEAAQLLRQYQQKGGTLVCMHTPHDIPCDQILLNREASLRLAIRHLLEAGHQQIGLCGFVTRDLVKTLIPIFYQELENYGVDPSLSCLIDTNTNTEDGVYMVADEVRGAALAEKFRQLKNRPTALCIINDIIATTFVHQILLAGFKVPEDVSVIAIDGMPVSLYGMVKITTVAQPRYEMAAKAVEFLLQRLDGTYRGGPRKLVYTGEVIARDSVRKI